MHLSSETKARKRFLFLYLVFVLLLIGLLDYFYYRSQEQLMLSHQRIRMMEYASTQARRLKQLHRHYPQEKKYPRDERFQSAIYDLEYVKIFSTLKSGEIHLDEVIYQSGEMIHLIKILDDYYLGAKYLVIEIPKDRSWYSSIWGRIVGYSMLSLLLLMLLGIYLSRLFVKPMHNSIMLLDRFIKDTTHELNTPLSAILTNIEMMDRESMNSGNTKKLNRIEIGARTVSTLYEDLKFLTLESNKPIENERVDILPLLKNRLEYFALPMQSKHLKLQKEMVPSFITIDKRLFTRVVDNLLSNAIKYNKRGGIIDVTLEQGCMIIADSGIGIPQEKLESIFERYSRFNESEGGFGIGLNIVKKIIDHYGMEISVESKLDQGTRVILRWREV